MPSVMKAMAGIKHIPAGSLHVSKPTHWLESRFHFSFAGWVDPKRMNFGALRVMNDDLVTAGDGFGRHPHRDAEIFSYILDGQLTHQDSMGNRESLGRGCVQYLSAGKGITHSEMNDGAERCRFIQVWITPDQRGHAPQYGSAIFDKGSRHNKLLHLLGGTSKLPDWQQISEPSSTQLHQDCNVFVSEADAGHVFECPLAAGRQMYALCMEGSLHLNEQHLTMRDAAELTTASSKLPMTIKAGSDGCHFMLIEMQQP